MGGYHEVVVAGPAGFVFPFTLGHLQARGLGGAVYDAEEEGFDCAPLRERLGEMLRPRMETVHLLVPTASLEAARRAIATGAEVGRTMSILSERPVRGRFSFSFTIASREHAARIRGLLEEPGGGLRLADDTTFEERSDPHAQGSEAYSPAHEYEMKGRGSVEGPVDVLLGLYRRCRDEELIRLGNPELIDDPA
jgi:hypothetical protein